MYCAICDSEDCEHTDRSCPCGCECGPDNQFANCVYDSPEERDLKNAFKVMPDEVVQVYEFLPCKACDGTGRYKDALICGHCNGKREIPFARFVDCAEIKSFFKNNGYAKTQRHFGATLFQLISKLQAAEQAHAGDGFAVGALRNQTLVTARRA